MNNNIHEEILNVALISTVKHCLNREKVTDSLVPFLSKFIFSLIKSEAEKADPKISLKKLDLIIFGDNTKTLTTSETDGRQWRNFANGGRTLKPKRAREIVSTVVDNNLMNLQMGLILWYLIDAFESAARVIKQFSKPNETIIFNQNMHQLMLNEMHSYYDAIKQDNEDFYEINGLIHSSKFFKKACMMGSEIAFMFTSMTDNIEDFNNPEFFGNIMLN